MRNCENCYHFHMCDLQYRLEEHQDCKHYKDKSLIIDLPCKIGDMVYKVNPLENAYSQILVLKVLAIELSDKEVVDLKITKKYRNDFKNYYSATFDDFGKTIFLSREEAEKKLKEYEGEQ